jgi:hypothetical protein
MKKISIFSFFVLYFFLLFVGAANAGKMVIEITAWEDQLDTLYINGNTMQWYYHGIFQPVGLWNWLSLSTQVPTHVTITDNGITLLDEDWTQWKVLPTFEIPSYSSTLSIPPIPKTMNTLMVDVTFDHSSTDSFAFDPVYPNLVLNFYDPDPEAHFHKATVTIYYDCLVDMNDGTIYDTDTQLSWLKNANTAGVLMTWDEAVAWAASLNTGRGFAGLTGWRLPTTTQPDATCSNQDNPGGFPLQGYQYYCTGSEMGYLHYVSLGNPAGRLYYMGPFTNMQGYNGGSFGYYWSSTEFAPDTNNAWRFDFEYGIQYYNPKTIYCYAWAVRPGARSLTVVLIENLVGIVDELSLPTRISTSLNDKLNAAIDVLEDGNPNNNHAAINILNSFVKAVKAQIGKKISTSDANNLIAQAREIISDLQSQ